MEKFEAIEPAARVRLEAIQKAMHEIAGTTSDASPSEILAAYTQMVEGDPENAQHLSVSDEQFLRELIDTEKEEAA